MKLCVSFSLPCFAVLGKGREEGKERRQCRILSSSTGTSASGGAGIWKCGLLRLMCVFLLSTVPWRLGGKEELM